MAGKAKFDQESAFKSIIGPGSLICRLIFALGLNLVNRMPRIFTPGLQYFWTHLPLSLLLGPARSLCHRFLASLRKKAKVKIGYRDLIFWIGILIRLCVRWHWRRRRILRITPEWLLISKKLNPRPANQEPGRSGPNYYLPSPRRALIVLRLSFPH